MRRAEPILIGLAIALAVIGVTVRALTVPFVTSALVDATGGADLAGLDATTAQDLAQQVRGYVTGSNDAALPERVGDRQGFTADAVAHLDDVRDVIRGAGAFTLALVLGIAGWTIVRWRAGCRDLVARSMRAAAAWVLASVPVAALAATLDFDRFFAAFHALFFQAGTWQFPADDLLIQLFPEPFWASAGALWGLLVLVAAGALAVGSGVVGAGSAKGSSADRPSDT